MATNEKGYKIFADNEGTPRATLGDNTTNVSITYKWENQGTPANRKFLVEAYNNVGMGKREKIVPYACP